MSAIKIFCCHLACGPGTVATFGYWVDPEPDNISYACDLHLGEMLPHDGSTHHVTKTRFNAWHLIDGYDPTMCTSVEIEAARREDISALAPSANTIVDQPDPIYTTSRPVWEALIEAIRERCEPLSVWPLMLEDMQARHRLGVERYGTPLQYDNGRDHLVDAYQEVLDGMVYLASDLMKRGKPITYDGVGLPDAMQSDLERLRRTAASIRMTIDLRTPMRDVWR